MVIEISCICPILIDLHQGTVSCASGVVDMAEYPLKKASEFRVQIAESGQWNLRDVLPHDGIPWYRKRHLLLLNLCMVVPYLSSTTNGYDGSMLNGLQSMSQWQAFFHLPTGARLGSLSNGVIFGTILAFPIAPWIADHFGRRLPIFLGSTLLLAGAVIQCAAQNYGMFLASRLIIGLGAMTAMEASPALVSELAYPTHRPILTAWYNTLWYLGALLAAWVTYGTYFMGAGESWSWRIPSLLQGLFPLFQAALVYLIPESPRWLVTKGRYDEARKLLVKWHAGGDENSALVEYEMTEIRLQVEATKLQHSTSYLEFLKTKGNRHRLFICIVLPCMMQLSGNGLVGYYLHIVLDSIGMTSSAQQLRINGGLMIFNYVQSVALASTVEVFGRRRLFLFSTIGMLVSFVIWTILSAVNQERDFKDSSLGTGIVVMIFFFYFSYNAALNGPSWLYITEVLPTYLRVKGSNIVQIVTTCCLIYNGYVNPVAMQAITWRYYIVWCCLISLWVVLAYFYFPETKGRSLEEVALVFDGDKTFGVHSSSETVRRESNESNRPAAQRFDDG